jgi:hypothetical protein
MERNVFSHPPYSPDLTPSDFQLFRTLKNAKREGTFADDELKYSTHEELRHFKKESYAYSVSKCVDNEGDFVEK